MSPCVTCFTPSNKESPVLRYPFLSNTQIFQIHFGLCVTINQNLFHYSLELQLEIWPQSPQQTVQATGALT